MFRQCFSICIKQNGLQKRVRGKIIYLSDNIRYISISYNSIKHVSYTYNRTPSTNNHIMHTKSTIISRSVYLYNPCHFSNQNHYPIIFKEYSITQPSHQIIDKTPRLWLISQSIAGPSLQHNKWTLTWKNEHPLKFMGSPNKPLKKKRERILMSSIRNKTWWLIFRSSAQLRSITLRPPGRQTFNRIPRVKIPFTRFLFACLFSPPVRHRAY